MKNRFGKEAGLTLIEVLIVIVIVSIALMMISTMAAERVKAAKIRVAVNQLEIDLRAARLSAVSNRSPVEVVVRAEPSNSYEYNRRPRRAPRGADAPRRTHRQLDLSDQILAQRDRAGRCKDHDRGGFHELRRGKVGRANQCPRDLPSHTHPHMNGEQHNMKSRLQGGFSLVEVVLSLGLLAAVLLPTAFLLDLASREAKSGGTSSEALAVARSILEEMEGWGFHEIHWGYGLDGKAVRYRVDTRKNSHASKWQAALDAELHNAYAMIEINSLSPAGGPPPLESTQAIRITVTVFWQEQQRHRSIQLSATRM